MAGPNARPELKLIYNLPICDWKNVGSRLGVSEYQIRIIDRNNVGDENGKKREMLSQWLRQDANATYATLADVLQTHDPPEVESIMKLESNTRLHFVMKPPASSAPVEPTSGPTSGPPRLPSGAFPSTPNITDAYSKQTGVNIPLQNGAPPTSCAQVTTQSHTAASSTQNKECSVMDKKPSEDYCMVSSDGGSTASKAYKMKSPHGIALVISNIKFYGTTGLEKREGADADEKNLSELFDLLGYKVVLLQNLTGAEINLALRVVSGYGGLTFEKLGANYKKYLMTLSSGDNLIQADHDSFVCCLLSHGTTGLIYGIDKATFDLNNIYEYLGSCEHLSGKPKMVFIQSCQGEQTAQSDGADPSPIVQSDGGNSMYTTQSKDFLMSFAAFYGQKSFRWTEGGKGSWYINALCKIFKNEHKEKDVLSMITEVHRKVMKKVVNTNTGEQCCQCPRLEHTLRYSVQLAVKGGWLW